MGKDLKGKELGVGISQRKDGFYTARVSIDGKRVQKYFKKLQECRQWIADTKFQKEHGSIKSGESMTVDAWFEYWINNVKETTVRQSTIQAFMSRYKINIQKNIGDMLICDVKPLHCQNILNQMRRDNYSDNSIRITRTTMHGLFQSAEENGLVAFNPIKQSVKAKSVVETKKRDALTIEEQRLFLQTAQKYQYNLLYRFALQTGLRIGEILGLRWGDIDFDNCVLSVQRTMNWFPDIGWITDEPKTKSGKRKIPLTKESVGILKLQKKKNAGLKVVNLEFKDHVFLNAKGNLPSKANIDGQMRTISRNAGIKSVSAHMLRHTFATRCIEAGMKPKTLQSILGHSTINITMNLYVHVTEDEQIKEIGRVEKYLVV